MRQDQRDALILKHADHYSGFETNHTGYMRLFSDIVTEYEAIEKKANDRAIKQFLIGGTIGGIIALVAIVQVLT